MAKFIDLDEGLPALLNKVKAWVNSKTEDFITAEDAAGIVAATGDLVIVEHDNYIDILITESQVDITPASLALYAAQKSAVIKVSGTHLKNDISISVPTGFTASPSTIAQVDGTVAQTDVTIAYTLGDATTASGNITATAGDVVKSIPVAYSQYAGPTILADSTLTIKAATGQSNTGTLQVTGSQLTAGINASVSGTGFTVSASESGTYGSSASLPSSGGTLYVKFSPTGSTGSTGTLTLSSTGATSKTVDLTGAVAGTLSISPASASIGIASGGSGTTQFTVTGANLTPASTATVEVSGTGMSADKQTLTVGQDGTINEVVTVTFSGSADSNGTLTVSHADVDNDATASVVGVITTPLPVGYYFDKDKVRYTVLSGQQTVSAKKVDTTTTAGAIEIPASVSDLGLEATDGTNTATGTGMTYSVADIPQNAFLNCSSITSLVINANVTSLPNQAFANVGSGNGVTLSRITICASVTNINQYCFYGAKPVILDIYGNPFVGNANCSGNNKLEKVIIRGSGVASASASSFNTPSLQNGKCRATLYVPDDLIDDYRAKEYIGTAGVASGVSYCAFPDEGQIKGISELS